MLESYRAFKKLKPNLTKKEFEPFYEEYIKPKSIEKFLHDYGDAKNLEAKNFSGDTLIALQNIFNLHQVALLFRCTEANISIRSKKTKEANEDSETVCGADKINLGDDPYGNYRMVLERLQGIFNNSTHVGDTTKVGLELLKYNEPKVLESFDEKQRHQIAVYELIINKLLPEASKRIRGILRSLNSKAEVDLRIIFRDILPRPSDLIEYIEKQGKN